MDSVHSIPSVRPAPSAWPALSAQSVSAVQIASPRPSVLPTERRAPSLAHMRSSRSDYHYLEDLALCVFELTPAERQLGHLLLQGLFYGQIAKKLYRSESTIKADARRIFAKARVKNRRAFEQHVRALVESL